MEGGIVEVLEKEVEEGWAKVWQTIDLGKSVDSNVGDVWLAVDVERGA